MDHIDEERLQDFANELVPDFTEAENSHIDDCATCWSRLVATLQLMFLLKSEVKMVVDFIM